MPEGIQFDKEIKRIEKEIKAKKKQKEQLVSDLKLQLIYLKIKRILTADDVDIFGAKLILDILNAEVDYIIKSLIKEIDGRQTKVMIKPKDDRVTYAI